MEAVLEHGQCTPGEPAAVLGARELETAALADETQIVALGDMFGPERTHGVRHQIKRAVLAPWIGFLVGTGVSGRKKTAEYPARPRISPRWPYRSPE